MIRQPAYLRVYYKLRDQITGKAYQFGQRLPSKRQLADESQAEARMGCGTPAARIEIPPQFAFVHAELLDTGVELVVVGLALRTADDLAGRRSAVLQRRLSYCPRERQWAD